MADDDTATFAPDNLIDGGTPTDEEARLGAQIDTIGDNPSEEPDDTPAVAAADDDPEADVSDVDASAKATAALAADDAKAAAVPAAPAASAAAQSPTLPNQAPAPTRDFEAEFKTNQDKFDSGEIDASEFQKTMRDLSREESGYLARVEIFNERLRTAAQLAQAEFNSAAVAWETEHQDFMANPLRAKAMQDAISAVDSATAGLASADVLRAAQKIAFEAYGYNPPSVAQGEEAGKAKAIADALNARKPGKVPATLANAPTAAHVDAPVGNTAYAALDALGIDDLENRLASMNPDQVDAYLRDAPGANASGR